MVGAQHLHDPGGVRRGGRGIAVDGPPYEIGRGAPVTSLPPGGIVFFRGAELMCAVVVLSAAKIQRFNAWRYYIRDVAFGDGRRAMLKTCGARWSCGGGRVG